MTQDWKELKVSVPPGSRGDVRVDRFEVSREGASMANLRSMLNPHHGSRGILIPGTYTSLHIGNVLVMSDTPDEIFDHLLAIRLAQGRCLVHGLGIGVVLQGMLMKEEVEHVTVVEINPDVIGLVGPHYVERFGEERLSIIQGDAFTWKPEPGVRYEVVWHDVWNYITKDNLPEMKTLHRRFGRRAEWQGSWKRKTLEML